MRRNGRSRCNDGADVRRRTGARRRRCDSTGMGEQKSPSILWRIEGLLVLTFHRSLPLCGRAAEMVGLVVRAFGSRFFRAAHREEGAGGSAGSALQLARSRRTGLFGFGRFGGLGFEVGV